MAPTIRQVMQGIEDRLDTISGLQVRAVTPDQVNPPQAFVGVPSIPQYHASMSNGVFTIEPTVTVLTSAALDNTGQFALADYSNAVGADSVKAAIEADPTLGGVVDDTTVVSFEALGLTEVGAISYYAGRFQIRVIAKGD